MPFKEARKHQNLLQALTSDSTNNDTKILGLATNGTQQQIGTDNNNNVKCNVVSAVSVYPHGSANAEGSPSSSFNCKIANTANIKLEDLTSSLNADHANNNKSIAVKQRVLYENQTAVVSGLTVYGSNNGTSIDMNGYRNIVIKVRSSATTGLSPLQNLKLYYSLEGGDFTLGEVITQNEIPSINGNYQGIIRLENVGFRYIQFYSVGVKASPTAYYISYSRYN